MANDTKDKVMALVEKRLAKDPNAETSDLYESAKEVDPAVGDLTLRQFHARYPLQVKRRAAAARGGTRRRGRRPRSRARRQEEALDRSAVRKSLLRFAQDISAAEGKAEVIDVLANLDRYVEEIAGAVNGRG